MLTICTSPTHLFCTLNLFFLKLYNLQRWSQLQQCLLPFRVLPLDVVVTMDAMPSHLVLIFRVSFHPYDSVKPCQVSMCNVHIALQELQAAH